MPAAIRSVAGAIPRSRWGWSAWQQASPPAGSRAACGLGTAALGYSKGTQPNRTRPIFELRSLGRVYADDLVEAGLIIWDYVAQANTEEREAD